MEYARSRVTSAEGGSWSHQYDSLDPALVQSNISQKPSGSRARRAYAAEAEMALVYTAQGGFTVWKRAEAVAISPLSFNRRFDLCNTNATGVSSNHFAETKTAILPTVEWLHGSQTAKQAT